jgi:hypothetical protein
MKYFISLFMVFASFSGQAQYIIDDFRHMKFGTHIDSIYVNNKKVVFKKNQELSARNSFVIENDDLALGSVSLKRIYYIFNDNDRFERVAMVGAGNKAFREMKYILTYKFDDPQLKDLADGIQYSWNVDGVRVYLTYQPDGEHFTVDIQSDYELSESKKKNQRVNDF